MPQCSFLLNHILRWLTENIDVKPLLTRSLSISQIEAFSQNPTAKPFPNNNQAVECVITIISQASCAVGTSKSRHGLILSKLSSQAILPKKSKEKLIL